MAKAKLPVSRAKTAYGLLSEVCKLITEEPLRYNQERFFGTPENSEKPPRGFPACNTVGCVAGWVYALRGPNVRTVYGDVERFAAITLGLDNEQTHDLFTGGACGNTSPQTPKHARAGVKHIRQFQQKYRAQLLAKKV